MKDQAPPSREPSHERCGVTDDRRQRERRRKGEVAVAWTVGPTGTVGDVAIRRTTLRAAEVEGCIVAVIAAWRFAAPTGGRCVEVNHTFVFEP